MFKLLHNLLSINVKLTKKSSSCSQYFAFARVSTSSPRLSIFVIYKSKIQHGGQQKPRNQVSLFFKIVYLNVLSNYSELYPVNVGMINNNKT